MGKCGPPYTFDINEMLTLRIEGWNYSDLGRKYGKDHTTIRYHCVKLLGSAPKNIAFKATELVSFTPVPVPHKYDYLINEKVNHGKSYKNYLKDAKKRDIWYSTYAKKTLATRPTSYKKEA